MVLDQKAPFHTVSKSKGGSTSVMDGYIKKEGKYCVYYIFYLVLRFRHITAMVTSSKPPWLYIIVKHYARP